MGALEATGLDWKFSNRDANLVIEVEGQENQGLNGWMYKVNDAVPAINARLANVKAGDRIIWWYSTDAMNTKGPAWPNEGSGGSTIIPGGEDEAKATIKSYEKDLAGLKENKLINPGKRMTTKAAEALKEELMKNKVDLALTAGQGESFLGDGEVFLSISEKSLSQDTRITIAEVKAGEEPKQFAMKLGSSVYEFAPKGIKFNQPITIAIKVPLTEDIDINQLSPAWYNEESKLWVSLPGVIDLESGLVVFQIDHFTKFAVIQWPARKSFPDVGLNFSWAQDAVEILGGKGYLSGTGNGFEPRRAINRGEFVKMMVTVLGIEPQAYSKELFKDVEAGDWFASYVQGAYEHKIILGDADGQFRPEASISRNEVAVIFQRLKEKMPTINQEPRAIFKDSDQIPAWAQAGVDYVFAQGLMTGYEDGTFKGSNSLSRAEAAVTVYRYLGFREEQAFRGVKIKKWGEQ